MCKRPVVMHMKDRDQPVTVPCRKCKACKAVRRLEKTGRVLAETADTPKENCRFVTFTYAGGYDNPDAYWLDYVDIQKMMKRLRNAGYRFKYVCVGEYGGQKGRAHWHVLFFFEGKAPDYRLKTQPGPARPEDMIQPHEEDNPLWPHGHMVWEPIRSKDGATVYVMKYMEKSIGQHEQVAPKMRMSANMGLRHMIQIARDTAQAGLPLFQQGNHFCLQGQADKDGKAWKYPIPKETAGYDRMLLAYVEEWARRRPNQRMPMNEHIYPYVEDMCQNASEYSHNVQHWLANVYGIEDPVIVESSRDPVHTYVLDPYWSLEFWPALGHLTVRRLSREGKTIWQHIVTGVFDAPVDPTEVRDQLLRIALPVIASVPSWTERDSETTGVSPQRSLPSLASEIGLRVDQIKPLDLTVDPQHCSRSPKKKGRPTGLRTETTRDILTAPTEKQRQSLRRVSHGLRHRGPKVVTAGRTSRGATGEGNHLSFENKGEH